MIRHPQQTAFHIGPSHWIVARVASRPGCGFDVIEITPQASRTHYRGCPRRTEADVLAAALAATRIHNLTAEGPR